MKQESIPKQRPIPFSGEMPWLISMGAKTKTRRVVKPQPEHRENESVPGHFGTFFHGWNIDHEHFKQSDIHRYCPYGQIGDLLIPAMGIPSLGRNYCADVYGSIWSRARNGNKWRRLSGASNGTGYLTVTPAVNGKYKTRLVHRLVAEAFYGLEPNGYKQVRHLDGIQLHNAPMNLDWGTQSQNWTDRLVHAKANNYRHCHSKLTQNQVYAIRSASLSQRKLAKIYGVSQSTIQCVLSGKTWKENPEQAPPNFPRWDSRMQLEIIDIRVERLNDISEEDAISEGARNAAEDIGPATVWSFRKGFQNLWEYIYGKDSWKKNEYVWVISFRKI